MRNPECQFAGLTACDGPIVSVKKVRLCLKHLRQLMRVAYSE